MLDDPESSTWSDVSWEDCAKGLSRRNGPFGTGCDPEVSII